MARLPACQRSRAVLLEDGALSSGSQTGGGPVRRSSWWRSQPSSSSRCSCPCGPAATWGITSSSTRSSSRRTSSSRSPCSRGARLRQWSPAACSTRGPSSQRSAMGLLYALSVLAWFAVARRIGLAVGLVTTAALLVYPGYVILFHRLSSDALFAAGFALLAYLVSRAVDCRRPAVPPLWVRASPSSSSYGRLARSSFCSSSCRSCSPEAGARG